MEKRDEGIFRAGRDTIWQRREESANFLPFLHSGVFFFQQVLYFIFLKLHNTSLRLGRKNIYNQCSLT